jgi:hypothetical protein
MLQAQDQKQVSPLASSPVAAPSYAPKYKRLSARLEWQHLRYRWRLRFQATMCIWRNAVDSFLGHIRSQSTRELPSVDYGPAFLHPHVWPLRANIRTHARAEYTRGLLAVHPWADTVDRRMFLLGFDAGEEWALHKRDIEPDTHPYERPSWLVPLNVIGKLDQQIKKCKRPNLGSDDRSHR